MKTNNKETEFIPAFSGGLNSLLKEPEFWQCEHMIGSKGVSCPKCREESIHEAANASINAAANSYAAAANAAAEDSTTDQWEMIKKGIRHQAIKETLEAVEGHLYNYMYNTKATHWKLLKDKLLKDK